MALDLIAELEGLVAAFDAAGIEYALCGGLALAVHGHPRATMDIDLLVTRDSLAESTRVAKQAGFDVPGRKMVFGLRTGTPHEVHRVSKIDPTTHALMSLDLLVVSPDLEPVWADRRIIGWGARTVSVVSREGLATMKRIAGRPQDLVDIAILEGTSDDDEA